MAHVSTENGSSNANVKWSECEACGARLPIDPPRSEPKRCAECESKLMQRPLLGGRILLAIIAVVIFIAMSVGVYVLQT